MKKLFALITIFLCFFLITSCLKQEKTDERTDNTPTKQNNEAANKVNIKLEEKESNENKSSSNIFAVSNTNGNDMGFENMINLMAEHGLDFYKTKHKPDGLIGSDDIVLLKFNCQWSERGGTNTDLIKSVVEAITKHPDGFKGEVIIADNGQAQYGPQGRGGSVEWSENNAVDRSQSPKRVADAFAKDFKVSALVWDSITENSVKDYQEGDYEDGFILGSKIDSTGITISYPKFKTSNGTYINFKDGIWDKAKGKYDKDKLKILNMPVLKSHLQYCVTASIKSYMGTTSDKLTGHNAHISVGLGGMGSQMVYTRMPVLNILDAIWINPHPYSGPSTHYEDAVETGIVAASTDPAALDYFAAKYILIPAAEKLHPGSTDSMNPDATDPGSFGYWLRKSMEEINNLGFRATIDEKRINVFIHRISK